MKLERLFVQCLRELVTGGWPVCETSGVIDEAQHGISLDRDQYEAHVGQCRDVLKASNRCPPAAAYHKIS
jgi:hypothetical protein